MNLHVVASRAQLLDMQLQLVSGLSIKWQKELAQFTIKQTY